MATATLLHETHQTMLSKTDQKRLERLASKAGRTPQAMLRFVLRDGFAVCEEDIEASIKADKEFSRGDTSSHTSVMQRAKKQIKEAHKRILKRA